MKKCSKCQQEKNESEFYVKNKDRIQSYCKPCFNRYVSDRWIKRKIEALAYKGNKCIDCDIKVTDINYYIFDFHHLNPSTKELDWTKMRLVNKDKLFAELDKTVLLCSNCHRIRHYEMNLVDRDGIEPSTKN